MRFLRELLARLLRAAVDWIERCIPKYVPAAWNDGNGIEFNNNCYNYGLRHSDEHFRAAGKGPWRHPELAFGHEL